VQRFTAEGAEGAERYKEWGERQEEKKSEDWQAN
jgi:hypothetical protein